MPARLTLESARMGAWRTLPVAISVFAYGMVYGLLTREAGLTMLESVLSSGLIFAGSAQFVALDMWTHPLPVAALILTVCVVNLRHVLMSASLTPWMQGLPPRATLPLLFLLVDESWAMTYGAAQRGKADLGFLLGSGLLLWVTWMSATITGRLLGSAIPDPQAFGLDFAFTAVFLSLLAGLWRGKGDIPPWLVATATALIVNHFVPGKWYIVAGGLAGSLTGLRGGNADR
ncbi:4-azaleucine resistance transporter AzlC [Pseudodesulfovibrio indicus]|jgi:4-azaleucine resistance transporter AzlC|uniref:4-azaleucine resistance transporter AzlC n=1 Tax=Pseudodesulfovibrio indicus TaxID=1716143 RepID=A0A126QQ06_9BACT|nr:AzlC family protein [Pseudodesulfovibrio indicus]TDT88338.1 4-azaleucine resistance transporter AzlC [Pseudodesulfovibrio indicus]